MAFFNTYLRDKPPAIGYADSPLQSDVGALQRTQANRSEYLPYLSAAAARTMSMNKPMQLDFIGALSPQDLKKAYGKKPPIPIVPAAVESVSQLRDRTIVEEIKRTGVLQVAMRRDVAPVGYINQNDEWSGYCGDLAIALRDYLTAKLEFEDVELELVELPSTSQSRFSLVRDNVVHLECGPNTVRQNVDGIAFSNPFMATGTRFLTQSNSHQAVNPNRFLADVRVGVLKNSTAEAFVGDKYPQANIVLFEGVTGQEDAVKAVMEGRIDTFAHDSLLTLAEVVRQKIPSERYTFSPHNPLTCNFYGLILPDDDPEWRRIINQFMGVEKNAQLIQSWFAQTMTSELNDLDYCLNR
ncbi:transporter substrate-binding domain-containing protein [Myxosarcina sp. GI1(2024)]